MRTLAWLLAVVVVTTSPVARAEASTPPARGGLTVLGLSLTALGVGGAGLGLGALLSLGSIDAATVAYQPYQQADAEAVAALLERRDATVLLMAVGFAAGAALLATGVLCLALDAPKAPVLTVVPVREGALVAVGLRW